MPSISGSIFQDKLALYKEQMAGTAKDENLSKRLGKSHQDYQQHRQIDFTKIKIDPNKKDTKTTYNLAGRIGGYGVDKGGGVLGLGGTKTNTGKINPGNYTPIATTTEAPGSGKGKVLSLGRRWTTSGYQSFGSKPLLASGSTKNKDLKTTLKDKAKAAQKNLEEKAKEPTPGVYNPSALFLIDTKGTNGR